MNVISLGRYGDICNILPAMYGANKNKRRSALIVGQEFADLLDGVTYCDRKTYSLGPEYLHSAIATCCQLPDLRIAQVDRNPDQRHLESSYCKEAYRLANLKSLWRKYPLVFDRRDLDREKKLVDRMGGLYMLVAADGVSSPFKHKELLVSSLRNRFGDEMKVVDMATIRAEKPYDLIGLMDKAQCLVTIDTLHLHLANAARCPTVSLINEGWRGSVPPCTSVSSFRYSEFQVDQVGDEVEAALGEAGDVWAIVDRFGQERRHEEAFKAQSEAFGDRLLRPPADCKTAKGVGHGKPLPSLKSMLLYALMFAQNRDIIIWTNDDVLPMNLQSLVDHAAKFGACSVRRDPTHIGREMLAFRWDWLADRVHTMPECFVAAPWFDLAVAAWIRKQFNVESDLDNLKDDFYPCELPNDSIFVHPPHHSSWLENKRSAAALWNQKALKQLIQ